MNIVVLEYDIRGSRKFNKVLEFRKGLLREFGLGVWVFILNNIV